MRSSVSRRVRPIADAQLGVLTSAQLRRAGVDLEVPRRERWLHLADGIWVVHDDPTDEQLLVAFALYAPTALVSGPLACRWLGLRHVPASGGADALVPHGTNLLGGPLLRTRQTRRMPHAVEHAGRRVAPAARAVADAARWTSSLQDARAVVLAALADRTVRLAELRREADGGATRTAGLLNRALADWERGARSAPEAEAADALLALGGSRAVPPFLLNADVVVDGTTLGTADGYILSAGVGWEIDSREHHGSSDDLDATLRRHQRFADAGVQLLHVTPKRLRQDRARWVAEVAGRAHARIRSGWRPAPGLVVQGAGPLLGLTAKAS